MTPTPPPRGFQVPAAALRVRLVRIFPALDGSDFEVETTDLSGNAWNTLSVQRHRIRFADGSAPLECVEKRLGKILGIPPYEPVVQAWMSMLDAGRRLIRTPHIGVIETPFACYIYSEVVSGPHPNLGRIAAHAATGIAEMESASAGQLGALPPGKAFTCWRMDFFGPWSLWRPRYNLALALRRPLLRRTPAFGGIRKLALDLHARLRWLAADARSSPRCFSHLDLLSKNFIETEQGLHLIDWGEARIGRVGFDAGSYLHRLLRGHEVPAFEALHDTFMQGYYAQLGSRFDPTQVRRNALYFLALRTACYFLRPEVLRAHAGAPDQVERKFAWLLARLDEIAPLPPRG